MGTYIPAVSALGGVHAQLLPSAASSAPTALPVVAGNELPAWTIDLLIAIIVIVALLTAVLFMWRRGKNKIIAIAENNGTTPHGQ